MEATEAREWLENNDLRVEIDPPIRYDWRAHAAFVGDDLIKPGTKIQFVHVISGRAGGEIRGYVLVDGLLRVRNPCYTGAWPEMDSAAARECKARVCYYRIDCGWAKAEA